MKMAPGFIMRSCSAPIRSLVEAVSGTCRLMTSDMLSSSTMLGTWMALPRESLFSMS